ncbi:lipase member H-A-like [Sitodiplosis mosellana]|uniref:lipase member H-A-like n=1 Tax=Sitodiplosis mosellana TaxID=263140 RepID=UPI002444ABE9|nr:lipase member H-A-like [Sitodiplosis mosellana]XP_055295779.1 lipase member H-A-like [Sitodiplosis mosellana]
MFVLMISCVFVVVSICVLNSNAFDINKDLVFRLYTREDPVMYYALKPNGSPAVSETPFNSSRPTRIFVHGYKSKEKVIKRYTENYLDIGDYNFIAVDWIEGASTYNYYLAKSRVGSISQKLAGLIDHLVENGMNLKDLTIVGHSLGAHIAGRAAKQLKSQGKIANIIGLDPASVGFDFFNKDKRLTDSDADYVQIIHTDGDKFGFSIPLGHADFYPNGGSDQPGCPLRNKLTQLIEKCSHVRSHHLFLESLKTKFTAIQCVSYEEIKERRCTFNNVTAIMGGDITQHTPKSYGIFYLETKFQPPYNIPDYRSFNNIDFVTYT